ncbi:MAG TPA: NADH-quinone oxidoreductase subunit J [Opitutaceae bacterium]|jgi:NADH-quinone oxidoreductase subunit J|nr:NADH-quinone oxidoreductase subunit J [Opitutaceae bacterium]
MPDLFFYLFAAFTIVCAFGVVLNRNTVNAAICLLLCLFGVAALFTLLDAYLLAVLLVLVYAGAVVALFLFIVMLLDTQGGHNRPFKPLAIFASTAGFALLLSGVLMLVNRGEWPAQAAAVASPTGSVLKSYAELLFTTYLLPVQIMGFLLLIAMLGVIVLCKKFEGLEDVK